MGTRGFIGFVAGGRETIVYNHFDSYPECLGKTMLAFALTITDSEARYEHALTRAARLVHVDEDTPPTDEQIAALAQWTNPNVGGRTERPSWYQLLRETQGDPEAILAAGYAEHCPLWPADSLFCEWGYLLDLDENTFEVYEGLQKAPHTQGRYAGLVGEDGYYPVRRIAGWSLSALPTPEQFLAACEPRAQV